jgi:hypothetical protein
MKKSQKKIMIFVVRLYFTNYVVNNIKHYEKLKMNFATFPELCAVVSELEYDLKIAVKLDAQKSSLNSLQWLQKQYQYALWIEGCNWNQWQMQEKPWIGGNETIDRSSPNVSRQF